MNVYGIPYNVVGFELAYVSLTFPVSNLRNENLEKLLEQQWNFMFDYQKQTNDYTDVVNLYARTYENLKIIEIAL